MYINDHALSAQPMFSVVGYVRTDSPMTGVGWMVLTQETPAKKDTAAPAARMCFFMVTLLRRVGWGWRIDAWAGEVHDTPEVSNIWFAISVIRGSS